MKITSNLHTRITTRRSIGRTGLVASLIFDLQTSQPYTHTKKRGLCLFGIPYPLACLGLPIFPIAKQVSQLPMISTEITSLHFLFVICISIHLHPKTTKDWALLIEMLNLSFQNKVSRGIPWNQRNLRYPLPMVLLKIFVLCQRWDMFRSLKVIPEVF